MMTLIFLTLNAFANDDFLSDLEASIAQEQAEEAQPETPQKAQAVTPPATPSFEDDLSFDIPTDTNAINVVVESPDVDIDTEILSIDAPQIEDITIDAPAVESETLNIASPDEIEAQDSNKAESLEWEFETDSF